MLDKAKDGDNLEETLWFAEKNIEVIAGNPEDRETLRGYIRIIQSTNDNYPFRNQDIGRLTEIVERYRREQQSYAETRYVPRSRE